jgi:type II secretory pathway predicted ATPase ExeA
MSSPSRPSIREIARRAEVDPAVARRAVVNGIYPVRDQKAAQRLKSVIAGDDSTAAPRASIYDDLHGVQIEKNWPRRAATQRGRFLQQKPKKITEEALMLIQRCAVSQAARDYWGVPPGALEAPWRREDVFLGGDVRVAYEHMLAKARAGGLLALVGESGSGKTTVKDLLVGDLYQDGEAVVIEPHTQKMEETDRAGKTLKGGDIVEALMRELAPVEKLRRTSEAQLEQVAACLANSLAEHRERRHVLIIDEAHCLPKPTLRHLKRFLEMKNPRVKGLQRSMLSIILLGQPELGERLSPYDPSVREVWQRCEIAHLPPLGRALPDYLGHRLGKAATAFQPDAIVKLGEILTSKDGRSFIYPLAIDSWAAEILNASVGLGKMITAQHVSEAHKRVERRVRGMK